MDIKIKTVYYNAEVSKGMKLMFANNDDYVRHLDSLWQLRDGLYRMMELCPDLMDDIKWQFDTVNNLIGVLSRNRDVPNMD